MAAISDEKYVSLTTFRKNGTPVAAPVWIADLGDGTSGFTTASSSYKVKRLANDPRITLQPCDSRGNVREGTSVVSGTATVVHGADFESVRSRIKSKYGMQFAMINIVGNLAKLFGRGSGTDCAVVMTLDQ